MQAGLENDEERERSTRARERKREGEGEGESLEGFESDAQQYEREPLWANSSNRGKQGGEFGGRR